jgi:hypothetical protein
MPASLHLSALVVSLACLGFSARLATRSRWKEALIDLCMVALMGAVLFNPTATWQLTSGALLIILALVEAVTSRFMRPTSSAGHAHRALCLLVMGATTLAMVGHAHVASGVPPTIHSHIATIAFVGIGGLLIVFALAIKLGARLKVSSAGMLVATALMSVATIAA